MKAALPWLLRHFKRFIGYGLSAGIALVLVVYAFGTVPVLREFLRSKLNLATSDEVGSVKDAVTERTDTQVNTAIEFTARNITDRAMQAEHRRQDSLFSEIKTSIIDPGLARITSLEDQLEALKLEVRRGTAQDGQENTTREAKLDALLEEIRKLQKEEPTTTPRRTTKKEF